MALSIWIADIERSCDDHGLIVPECFAGRLACTPAEVAKAFIGHADVLVALLIWIPFDNDDVRELEDLSNSLLWKAGAPDSYGIWVEAVRDSDVIACRSIIATCVARQSPQSGYGIC